MKTLIGFYRLDAGGILIYSDGSIKYMTFFEMAAETEKLMAQDKAA